MKVEIKIKYLTTEFSISDIELRKHMARWKRHLGDIRGIPRSQHNASILRGVLNAVNALLQLVDPLTCVVGVHRVVGSTEVTPLEPVHRSQVAFFTMT